VAFSISSSSRTLFKSPIHRNGMPLCDEIFSSHVSSTRKTMRTKSPILIPRSAITQIHTQFFVSIFLSSTTHSLYVPAFLIGKILSPRPTTHQNGSIDFSHAHPLTHTHTHLRPLAEFRNFPLCTHWRLREEFCFLSSSINGSISSFPAVKSPNSALRIPGQKLGFFPLRHQRFPDVFSASPPTPIPLSDVAFHSLSPDMYESQ